MLYKKLTRREREIATLLVDGITTREICEQLCIAQSSLNSHINNMKKKTGVRSILSLIAYLINNKLVPENFFDSKTKLNCNLTHKEKEVLVLISEGFTAPELAEKLFVSKHTIETHKKNISRKVEFLSMTEIVIFYLKGVLNITLPNDDEFDDGLDRPYDLTKREFQILGRLVSGQSTREVSDDLLISVHSVESHKGRIFKKLGVRSAKEAIIKAIKESFYVLQIVKEIEFDEHHFKAGMAILSHFGTVLKQKNPDNTASVKIEQIGLKIRMTISYKDGSEKEVIEDTLYDYGEMIRGNIAPHEFFLEEDHILQFETEFQLAAARIQLDEKRIAAKKKIKALKKEVKSQHDIITAVTAQRDELRQVVGTLLSRNDTSGDGTKRISAPEKLRIPQSFGELTFEESEVNTLMDLYRKADLDELFKAFDELIIKKKRENGNGDEVKALASSLQLINAIYNTFKKESTIMGTLSAEESRVRFNRILHSILQLINALGIKGT